MSLNSSALAANDLLEPLERGQQRVGRLVERGEVHGAREHVVGGLPHVHVVVRVRAVAGERRDDLVGVHVRRRARAGLEDVDRELVVVRALRDLVRRRRRSAAPASASSSPSSAFARAAAPLMRPSHRTTATGTRSPDTGKFSTALRVSPPHSSCVVSTSCASIVSRSGALAGATSAGSGAGERPATPRPGSGVTSCGCSSPRQCAQTSTGSASSPHEWRSTTGGAAPRPGARRPSA